jgi:hypothetical protein
VHLVDLLMDNIYEFVHGSKYGVLLKQLNQGVSTKALDLLSPVFSVCSGTRWGSGEGEAVAGS